MSAPFNEFLDASVYALPWLAFLAGLGGSFHCVGMCGGLVTACSPNKKSIWHYQLGRLLGYSMLGLFAGTLGHLVSLQFQNNFLKIIPPLTLGLLFIFWGWKSFKGTKEIASPHFIKKSYDYLWKTIMPTVSEDFKPFGVGLFSILLPCGLLYTLVVVVAAFHDPIKALIAMFFFWLGTVPAMALAPNFFKKILSKVFNRSPKLIGISFMLLGVLTISYRLFMVLQANSAAASCH